MKAIEREDNLEEWEVVGGGIMDGEKIIKEEAFKSGERAGGGFTDKAWRGERGRSR